MAVRRYSVAACWSLIWVTFLACRRTLRVPRGALRSIWAILSGRAPPATLVIRGCLRCRRRRPAHRRCPGRMTITIVGAEASAPIRWWCTVCDDEGVISNWADTFNDLRRRRLSVAGDVDEVIVSDETAAVLRELVLLDPDCERLVFGMRAHPDGAVLLAGADDLEELIGFVAAEANHEPNRRRQHRLDDAFNALTEAAQTLYS